MTEGQTYVFYHKGCSDGTGAAFAARRYFKDDAVYIPIAYGDKLPNLSKDDTVYFVDFSLKRQQMIDLANSVHEIYVLDHHKTAQADLVDLPENVHVTFDMSKSGAVITWEHFFPDLDVPEVLLYIQDRDLWKWELEGSREVSAAIFTYPKDIQQSYDAWRQLVFYTPTKTLFDKGYTILSVQDVNITAILNNAHTVSVTTNENEVFEFAAVNSSLYPSELCHALNADGYPAACCYNRLSDGRWRISLRSQGLVDVSEIAAKFGGGGHKNAAGFYVDHVEYKGPLEKAAAPSADS